MQSKYRPILSNYQANELTENLRYQWVKPHSPRALEEIPYWIQPEDEPGADLIQELADAQIRVATLREQIARLGENPKGRTRLDLLRQLISLFLEPDRLIRQLGTLDEEQQQAYIYLLLYTNLEALQTAPKPLEKRFRLKKSRSTLTQQMLSAGLGLVDDIGNFFIPQAALSQLPPAYIEIETAPEPTSSVPAVEPTLLATRIQQWLNLLQTDTYQLRARPRWALPNAGYYSNQQATIWPLLPSDAKKITSGKYFQGQVTFCTPEPFMEETALYEWAEKLTMSPEMVEWLYHTLLHTGLITSGSPVKVNRKLAQQWLTLMPGRQAVIMYELYRSIASWADWWTPWRMGQLKVSCQYYNTWQLTGAERNIANAITRLRWLILDILSFMPHDVWLSMENVAQWIVDLFPDTNVLYFLQGLSLTAHNTWDGVFKAILQSMLSGALHELGMADLAPTRESPTLFRLHFLQDIHWGRYAELPSVVAQPLSAETVTYVADEQMLHVVPPAPAKFLAMLQKWCKPAGLLNNRLYYQPDVTRLHHAFERGETPETLTEAWEASADFSPLPEISAWWAKWWGRYGHIRIYPHQATLITRDDFTMQEVQLALPSLREAILGLVTPRAALLDSEQVDAILSGLERQGYMPKEED